jgi:hypothetical protein
MDLKTLRKEAEALARQLEKRSFQCLDRAEGRKRLCCARRLIILSQRTLATHHSPTCLEKMDGGFARLKAEAEGLLA